MQLTALELGVHERDALIQYLSARMQQQKASQAQPEEFPEKFTQDLKDRVADSHRVSTCRARTLWQSSCGTVECLQP